MIKFIFIAIILTIMYILLGSLMKSAGKSTVPIPNIDYIKDENNKLEP